MPDACLRSPDSSTSVSRSRRQVPYFPSLKELCEQVSLSHSTVSGIVDRLQAKGMAARSTDSADRRLTRIAVTPLVRQLMQERAPRLTARPLTQALSRLSGQERWAASRGLRLLRKALEPKADGG